MSAVPIQEPTVLVVDDDPRVLRSLQRLLTAEMYRVEVFASPGALLEHASRFQAGCVLVDLRMPRMSGLELQEALLRQGFKLPLIFLTGHGDVTGAVQAMKAGAIDFLSKPCEDGDLLDAVNRALARDAKRRERDAATQQSEVERDSARARFSGLSPREREVSRLVATGLLNKQIAAELGIAVKTVKIHRGRAMKKLEVGSVAELVRLIDRL